jgi:hypothetical protein
MTARFPKIVSGYFATHGIDEGIAAFLRVTGWESGRLDFPYRGEDGLPFRRERHLPSGDMYQPKGTKVVPWTPLSDFADGRGVLLVCEGESDCLAAISALYELEEQADVENGEESELYLSRKRDLPPPVAELVPIAIPGTNCAHQKVADLAEKEVCDVWIALDGDDAGRTNAEKLAKKINAKAHCTAGILHMPDGMDLADVLAAADDRVETLANLVAEAQAVEEVIAVEEPVAGSDASDADAQSERKPSQGEILLRLAHEAGVELWATSEGDPMMTVPVAEHVEHHRLATRAARDWLGFLFYGAQERPPSAQAVQDTLGVLRGEALYAGARVDAPVRYAATEEATYLDLGDPEWRAVEITADGWRVVAEPPVRFRRPRGALALPNPVPGGSLKVLREMLNVDEEGWRLIVGFLVGTMAPHGPYPLLCFEGEAGSAKSTAARRIRELTDPNVAPLRSEPRDERDLAIAAANGRIIALDNVSRITPTLSDALCRLATGGAYATRELFSDTEETLLAAVRPAIITGITEVITRGDLADRALKVTLSPISDEDRRPEAELDARWEELRPIALGGLLDATVTALRRLPDVRPDRLPRLADHARWVMAAEPALGWEDGAYLAAYEDARVLANESALESSPLTAPLKLIAASGFEGTATDLLERIEDLADDDAVRSKSWPRSARSLSGMLRRLAPSLRESGIAIAFTRDEKRRLVTVQEGTEPDRHVRHDRQEDAPPHLFPDANDAADANDGLNGSFLSQEGPPDLASCDDEAEAERLAEKFGVAI